MCSQRFTWIACSRTGRTSHARCAFCGRTSLCPRSTRTTPVIKGSIVAEAGDKGTIRGIRAADGHLRRVAVAINRAIKGLQETAAPDSTPGR